MSLDTTDRVDAAAAADPVDTVRALADLLDAEAPACERAGMLTAPVDRALRGTGLFGMWVPRSLGGLELDPVTSLRVIEEASRAQASAGWVLMAASLTSGIAGALLGDEAAHTLFGDDRCAVLAGQGTRPGRADPAEGGVSVTGEWSFGSAIRHADHVFGAVVTSDTGEFRGIVTPLANAELDESSWDVLGLRATGSLDYRLRDVHVPEPWTFSATSRGSERGGPFYRLGIATTSLIGHAGWALGVGRRLLDELAATARAKAGRAGQFADSDAFHTGYAEAEAKLRAARALVLEAWGDAWATLSAGDDLSTRQETLLRLSLSHATWTVEDVSVFAYRTAGTSALRAGTLQRLFRDVHAGTQHITSGPAVVRATGRELAGLAERPYWQMLDLVDGRA